MNKGKRLPITHILSRTYSSNSEYNADCDWCVVEMTPEDAARLLGHVDELRRMMRADRHVHAIECWDHAILGS